MSRQRHIDRMKARMADKPQPTSRQEAPEYPEGTLIMRDAVGHVIRVVLPHERA